MRFYTEYFWFQTRKRRGYIPAEVENALSKRGLSDDVYLPGRDVPAIRSYRGYCAFTG